MADDLPAALDGTGRRTAGAEAIEAALLLGGFALPAGVAGAALGEVREAIATLRPSPDDGYDPAEMINRMIAAGKAGTLDFWRSRYVATERRLLAERCGTRDGVPDVAALPPRRFTVEISRRFDLTGAEGSRARLRLPLPLAGPALDEMVIELRLPDRVTHHSVAPGRLEAVVADAAGEIAIGARLSFTARAGMARGPDPTAGDPRWLAPGEGPIQLTAGVRALAARLATDAAPADAVRACYDHLIDHYTCGVVPYDRVSGAATDWVLATGWYDCRLGAALLVALARARGIPARLVSGYLLWRRPTEHYWAEVHLPGQGWTPYDLLGWDLSAGGADAAWRGVLSGAVDYRMQTQQLPDIFTGAAGGPSAPAWHRLVRATATATGTETRFVSIADGRLLHAEEVSVTA